MRLIDADKMRENLAWCKEQSSHSDSFWDDVIERLDVQPTVDAVPVRHGRWKGLVYDGDIVDSLVFHIWMCSECGQRHFGYKNTLTNFCPHCGADMREEGEMGWLTGKAQ